MIDENININIFNKWVLKNKDEGMEKGHASSVSSMLEIVNNRTDIFKNKFNFLDLGCGNGWVVRKFSNNQLCNLAVGIDGSKNMIVKAKSDDLRGSYYQSNIESWDTKNQFDIIFSMETFYYLKNIDSVLTKINTNFLKNNGFFIIGIDHYSENKPSLTWEDDIGIQTQTLSIQEWIKKFEKANFKNIKFQQVGNKEDWLGTLIISAFKN